MVILTMDEREEDRLDKKEELSDYYKICRLSSVEGVFVYDSSNIQQIQEQVVHVSY